MPASDSIFLFDITADSVQSFVESKNFIIKCHLPKFFTLTLKDPKGKPNKNEKNSTCNRSLRTKKGLLRMGPAAHKIITADSDELLAHLKENKLELSLWNDISPEIKEGASLLPWSQVILNFIKQVRFEPPPARITHMYNIYNHSLNKKVAIVKLTMRLALLSHKMLNKCLKKWRMIKSSRNKEIVNIPVGEKNTDSTKDIDPIVSRDQDMQEDTCISDIIHCQDNMTGFKTVLSLISIRPKDDICNFIDPLRSRSHSTLSKKNRSSTLKHIFGDYRGPYGDRVYCVGYVTVASDPSNLGDKTESKSSKDVPMQSTAPETMTPADDTNNTESKCSLNNANTNNILLMDCKDVSCENKCYRPLPDTSDKPILLDITTIQKKLCVTGHIDIEGDPCSCSCKCTFGFEKKTTYCGICGGYEKTGDEFRSIPAGEWPHPCPVYHKLIDKGRLRTSNSINSSYHDSKGSSKGKGSRASSRTSQKGSKGSDKGEKKQKESGKSVTHSSSGKKSESAAIAKKDKEDSKISSSGRNVTGPKKNKGDSKKSSIRKKSDTNATKKEKEGTGKHSSARTSVGGGGKPDIESEKEGRKRKPKKDNKFKFNYGYQGIPPKIGHAHCVDPCSGSLDPVPKCMGWLWTAEDIPGLKFRPNWRPGATHKNIVKMLKQAKYPDIVIGKKKKKGLQLTKKKRPLKRPLLVVAKKHGEFSVTLEHMKEYGESKSRPINLPPFEDKPPVTFSVGRTAEENERRLKKKLREQRRLERAQRMFIQNTFQDLCHEICLKTYQQALGILPDAEKPECPCYPALPDPERVDMNVSCSCSENSTDVSDTDSDEWLLEFTPPNCLYRPSSSPASKKYPKIDHDSQYTYLDYRVKVLDRHGNEMPRYFIGPNGNKLCSDLGGFKGPGGKWLQLGVDGYIAPDGRWAPNKFIGPNGDPVDCEEGKFIGDNGETYTVGVDGYVLNGTWKFYPKSKVAANKIKYYGKDNKEKHLKEQNKEIDDRGIHNKDKSKADRNDKGKGQNGTRIEGDYKHKESGNKNRNGGYKGQADQAQADYKHKEGQHHRDKGGNKGKSRKDNDRDRHFETGKRTMTDTGSQCDFSCFGTTSPRVLSEMGIRGHGHDRKILLESVQRMLSKGIKLKIPDDHAQYRGKSKGLKQNLSSMSRNYRTETVKCRHAKPSQKGVLRHDAICPIYFKLGDPKNVRPKERMANLKSQGKSLSSFHMPCFDSFLDSETLKKQVYEKVKSKVRAKHPESGEQF